MPCISNEKQGWREKHFFHPNAVLTALHCQGSPGSGKEEEEETAAVCLLCLTVCQSQDSAKVFSHKLPEETQQGWEAIGVNA